MGRSLEDALPHLCLGGVQLLFGATAVVGRLGMRGSSPFHFTVWRFMLAVPSLVCLSRWQAGGLAAPPRWAAPALLAGAVCLVGSNLGITLGIVLSGQVTASSWQPLQLLFGTALSFALGIEAPSLRKLAGVVMGLLGAAIIVLADPSVRGAAAQTAGSLLGHGALFANTFSSGALFVIRKSLVASGGRDAEPLAPLFVVAWMHVLAFPLVAALGVLVTAASGAEGLAGAASSVATPPADASTWAALAFYTLVPSVVCQSGTAWAAKALEPSTMATYSVLQPAMSAALSAVALALAPGLRGALAEPAANMLGVLPVLAGLRLISSGPAPAAVPKARVKTA